MYKAARCLKDKRHSAGAERLRVNRKQNIVTF